MAAGASGVRAPGGVNAATGARATGSRGRWQPGPVAAGAGGATIASQFQLIEPRWLTSDCTVDDLSSSIA